jgi:hypothetical protein
MEVSVQLHAPVVLIAGKRPAIPRKMESRCVSSNGEEENTFIFRESNPGHPAYSKSLMKADDLIYFAL